MWIWHYHLRDRPHRFSTINVQPQRKHSSHPVATTPAVKRHSSHRGRITRVADNTCGAATNFETLNAGNATSANISNGYVGAGLLHLTKRRQLPSTPPKTSSFDEDFKTLSVKSENQHLLLMVEFETGKTDFIIDTGVWSHSRPIAASKPWSATRFCIGWQLPLRLSRDTSYPSLTRFSFRWGKLLPV